MHVGIIDMNYNPDGIRYLRQALLGYEVTVVRYGPNLLERVRRSSIQTWICSGGAHLILEADAPHIPLSLLDLPEKRFMLICYSMESVLLQLGYRMRTHRTVSKGYFTLHGSKFWKNHFRYVKPADLTGSAIKVLATSQGEVMTATYKNALLVQWHPERSADGRRFLEAWIRSSDIL
jgi:GMP synthase-like glutamine amidotransferase